MSQLAADCLEALRSDHAVQSLTRLSYLNCGDSIPTGH